MEERIQAIPTTYNGINFRSRLEAKWAYFFDRIGLPWEYEPIDLNGYIPDFVLKAPGSPIFVEVKPALCADEFIEMGQKARLATTGKRLIVLGASICFHDKIYDQFNGFQCIRLNLCDHEYAETQIKIYGDGKPLQDWDESDKSAQECVIGWFESFRFITCSGCFKVSPVGWGHTSCAWCGREKLREDQFGVEYNGFNKFWREAVNATKYRHANGS